MVPFVQFKGGVWTEEQYFIHVTQYLDYGTRQGNSQIYTYKKGKTMDILSGYDGAYMTQTQSNIHHIYNHRIMENLTTNSNTMIVG